MPRTKADKVFISDNGHRLVISDSYIPKYAVQPFLTVEAYMKWCDLYVVYPQTSRVVGVKKMQHSLQVHKQLEALFVDNWLDHCLVPKAYYQIAQVLEVRTIDIAYEVIVARFLLDYLNDPTHLAQYLHHFEETG